MLVPAQVLGGSRPPPKVSKGQQWGTSPTLVFIIIYINVKLMSGPDDLSLKGSQWHHHGALPFAVSFVQLPLPFVDLLWRKGRQLNGPLQRRHKQIKQTFSFKGFTLGVLQNDSSKFTLEFWALQTNIILVAVLSQCLQHSFSQTSSPRTRKQPFPRWPWKRTGSGNCIPPDSHVPLKIGWWFQASRISGRGKHKVSKNHLEASQLLTSSYKLGESFHHNINLSTVPLIPKTVYQCAPVDVFHVLWVSPTSPSTCSKRPKPCALSFSLDGVFTRLWQLGQTFPTHNQEISPPQMFRSWPNWSLKLRNRKDPRKGSPIWSISVAQK